MDEFTRYLGVYLLEKSSEVFNKRLRTGGGGGEYTSIEFAQFCEKEWIEHGVITPYTPQYNGTAERKNTIILNMVNEYG